ncbi:MAG: hypothetical protein V1838_05975 [Patescibacteria group bacterium]
MSSSLSKIHHSYKSESFIFIAVFLFYLAAAVIFTWPVADNIRSIQAGAGADNIQVVGKIINQGHDLNSLSLFNQIVNPIVNLRFNTITIYTYLYRIFGMPFGFNLYWLFSFLASGLGVFYLTRHLLNKRADAGSGERSFLGLVDIAALVAGFIYAFAPAHMAWARGFGGATHTEWIPLTTLFVLLFLERVSLKYFLLSALSFLFLFEGEPHFAAFYLLFLIPLLGYYGYRYRERLKLLRWKYYLPALLIIGVVLLWSYWPLIKTAISEGNYLDPGIDQVINYSNDLLSPFIPVGTHPWWGNLFIPLRERFTGNPVGSSTYVGIAVLFLLIWSLTKVKIKAARFWGWCGIGFYVLSMGPFLHVAGLIKPLIPLPYLFVYKYLPFFDNIRVVNRLVVIAMLCLAIAAGYALYDLMTRHGRQLLKRTAAVLLVIFIGIEYLAIPFPTTNLTLPPFYEQLKRDNDNYAVLEIPSANSYAYAARVYFYQSLHRKEVVGGLSFARKIPGKYDEEKNTPIIRELLYLLPGKGEIRDILNYDPRQLAPYIFNIWDIRYLILNKDLLNDDLPEYTDEEYRQTRDYIEKSLKLKPYYEDATLVAYQTEMAENGDTKYLAIENQTGWEKPISENDRTARVMRDGAVVSLYTGTTNTQTSWLSMEFISDRAQLISYRVGEEAVGETYYIWPGYNMLTLPITTESTGDHKITFSLKDTDNITTGDYLRVKLLALSDQPALVDAFPICQPISINDPGQINLPTYALPELAFSDSQEINLYILPFWKQLVEGSQGSGRDWLLAQDIFNADYYRRAVGNALTLPNDDGRLTLDQNNLPKYYSRYAERFFDQWQPEALVKKNKLLTVNFNITVDPFSPLPAIVPPGWRSVNVRTDEVTERQLKGESTLWLYQPVDQPESSVLSFSVRGLLPMMKIAVEYNDEILGSTTVSLADTVMTVPLPLLNRGWHKINFRVYQNNRELIVHGSEPDTLIYISNLAIGQL